MKKLLLGLGLFGALALTSGCKKEEAKIDYIECTGDVESVTFKTSYGFNGNTLTSYIATGEDFKIEIKLDSDMVISGFIVEQDGKTYTSVSKPVFTVGENITDTEIESFEFNDGTDTFKLVTDGEDEKIFINGVEKGYREISEEQHGSILVTLFNVVMFYSPVISMKQEVKDGNYKNYLLTEFPEGNEFNYVCKEV